MGGAQPLAITMAEGVCLAAEVEEWRAQKRVETRYLDIIEHDLDKAIDLALEFKAKGRISRSASFVPRFICCNV